MKQEKELIKNTFIIAIGKFSTQIVSFLLVSLYTAKLTTEQYGNYDLIITIITFITPFITLTLEESMFRFLIDAKNKKEEKDVHDFLYTELEESMKQILGSKVSIKNKNNNKGKIEIEYYSKDELERIIDLIQSIKE